MALFYSPKLGFDGEKAGGSPTGTLDETVTRLLNYSVGSQCSTCFGCPNKGRRPILGLRAAHKYNCNETPLQHMLWRRKSPESLYAQNKNSFSSSKWFAMSVISENHSPRCWKSSLLNSGHETDSPLVTFSHSPFLRCFSPSIHSFLPYPQVGNFIVPFSFRCLCISNEFHSKCGSWPHPFLKHSNSALSK